jgi:hypothetical protein
VTGDGEELLAIIRDGKGVQLVAAADGLLTIILRQIAFKEGCARRRVGRKMLLPVFPHL